MEGFLEKKGIAGWTERWFVLEGKRVMYFATRGDKQPRGTLEINGGSRIKSITAREHAFHVVSDRQALTVNASSNRERERWMEAISAKIAQLRADLVIKPRRKNTKIISAWDTFFEVDDCYEYKKPVGHGAYGVVVSALDIRNNQRVAIKKIPDAFGDVVDAKRIVREVRLLRCLDHDCIIKVVDILPPPSLAEFDDVYIVSELMDTDLHRVIYSSQRLTDQHVKYFLYQLLCGVKYLHSARIMHRDLKPSNVLLSTNCDLKLCDFGLSRGAATRDDPADLTEYVVTRWYRAPEIMLAADYGFAIDVWSAGCIFAEMLRREPLFRGDTYLQMLKLIAKFLGKPSREDLAFVANPKALKFMTDLPEAAPADTARRFPDAPPEALDLLTKMLALHPAKRIAVEDALAHPYLSPLRDTRLERPAPMAIDFTDIEGGPLTKQNLQRLMYEDVCVYRPELRVPGEEGGAAGDELAAAAAALANLSLGGKEAAAAGKEGTPPTPGPDAAAGGRGSTIGGKGSCHAAATDEAADPTAAAARVANAR